MRAARRGAPGDERNGERPVASRTSGVSIWPAAGHWPRGRAEAATVSTQSPERASERASQPASKQASDRVRLDRWARSESVSERAGERARNVARSEQEIWQKSEQAARVCSGGHLVTDEVIGARERAGEGAGEAWRRTRGVGLRCGGRQ
eukprot:366299-Chlamydomonas_euryale.AAC.9